MVSSCKKQTSGPVYGKQLAEAEFVKLAFDVFLLTDCLQLQPLRVIVGNKIGTFGSYRDGCELFRKAASRGRDIHIVQGANRYDLYGQLKAKGGASG